MHKMMMNIMTTTGVSLVALAVIATSYQAQYLCINTVFQAFLANILIHVGIKLFQYIDFQYPLVETILSISYTIIVVLVCGKAFQWYDSTPIGVLIPLAVFVYLAGCCLRVVRIKREVKDINALLQKKNKG